VVILRCKLKSGWGLRKRRSAPPYRRHFIARHLIKRNDTNRETKNVDVDKLLFAANSNTKLTVDAMNCRPINCRRLSVMEPGLIAREGLDVFYSVSRVDCSTKVWWVTRRHRVVEAGHVTYVIYSVAPHRGRHVIVNMATTMTTDTLRPPTSMTTQTSQRQPTPSVQVQRCATNSKILICAAVIAVTNYA